MQPMSARDTPCALQQRQNYARARHVAPAPAVRVRGIRAARARCVRAQRHAQARRARTRYVRATRRSAPCRAAAPLEYADVATARTYGAQRY